MATTAGLNPEFLARVQAMMAAAPGKVTIGDAFRSRAQQAALYKAKPHLAAPPGRSRHERGEAIDFVFEGGQEGPVAKWVHANAARFGLSFPMAARRPGKKYEPWHGEMAGAKAKTGTFGVPANYAAAQQQQAVIAPPVPAAVGAAPDPSDRRSLDVQLTSFLNILDKPIDFAEVGG